MECFEEPKVRSAKSWRLFRFESAISEENGGAGAAREGADRAGDRLPQQPGSKFVSLSRMARRSEHRSGAYMRT